MPWRLRFLWIENMLAVGCSIQNGKSILYHDSQHQLNSFYQILYNFIASWSFSFIIFQIGQILKDKFDSAHEVHQKKKRGRRMLLPRFERFKPHTDTDLVYLKSSPDYCEFDVKRGSLGTHGRECDHRSPGIDGCELMCCNRGYTTRKEKRVERCKCKFHWCCFVECEECVREVEVSVCN